MFKAMLVKEFILILRDRHALAALFILPAVFILIMSLALKDTFESKRALLHYAVVDRDGSARSAALAEILSDNDAMDASALTGTVPEGLNGGLQFVLTIPKGYGEAVIRNDANATLLRLDAAADVKQEMLSLFKMQLAMAVLRQRLDALQAQMRSFMPQVAQSIAAIDFDVESIALVHFNAMEAGEVPTSTQQSVPSWIVFGMFFVIIPMSTIFISERKQNTLMRMSAMNISVPVLFAGKIVPYVVINQFQVWLMIGVGMFIVPLFGADPLTLGSSWGGVAMVSLGLSLAAVGLSVLIAVSVATVEQATTIGGILNVLMGAIGGVMVPKFVMPPAMQAFAEISPMSWGLEGFLDLFLRGEGAMAALPESLALAAFGAAALLLAGAVFNYKRRRGV